MIVIQERLWFQLGYATDATRNMGNTVVGCQAVVTALTSLMGTYIICRQIMSSSGGILRSKDRYTHLIQILIESCMLYSLTGIVYAVSSFLFLMPNDAGSFDLVPFELNEYFAALSTVITVSPTYH